MNLPNLDPSRSADALYADILDYVVKADAMVTARDPLSLAGLDTAVDALCKRVLALEENEAKKFAGSLTELLARIDQLQKKMMALQNEVATTINSLNKSKKATKAYKSAPKGTES